jgi:transcriptional regulator with XRE-family HTH domain
MYERSTSKLRGVQAELQRALGQRVRQLRLRKGCSQEAFADHCGVHRTFMGTIERGETNLSFQNLTRIAAGLGVTLSKLLSGVEQQAARLSGVDAVQPDAQTKSKVGSRDRKPPRQ